MSDMWDILYYAICALDIIGGISILLYGLSEVRRATRHSVGLLMGIARREYRLARLGQGLPVTDTRVQSLQKIFETAQEQD